ncbi:hypothetical protein [Microbacterium sp.]|uniref:hypothetical protein n=1 Tax=Microbacterium sp. TaxID=51671 RepID=UPI003F98FCDD
MHVLQAVSTPEPTPTPTMTVDPDLVTPGPAGFITIALLAIAVGLLAFDMLRRVRRARYREEARLALDAEEAAAHEATDDDGEPEAGGDADDAAPGDAAPDKPAS